MAVVTAKFKVARVSDMGWATEVELTPDYADGRNKAWAAATPAGMIRMTIKNQVAADEFRDQEHDVPKDVIAGYSNMGDGPHKTQTGRPKVVLFLDEDDPMLNTLGITYA